MDDQSDKIALIRLLAAGTVRYTDELARILGQSPARIESEIRALRSAGFALDTLASGGIRHPFPFELLQRRRIMDALGANAQSYIEALEVHLGIDSTNRHAMDRARRGEPLPHICLAEMQSAGRGRNGRAFLSPPGGNLYLSLAATTSLAAPALPALSPAIAVAVAQAIDASGGAGAGVRIKWPNDIHARGGKIAGILIESSRGPQGGFVIIGVGINLRLSPAVAEGIDQPVGDLSDCLDRMPPRNIFAARVIDALVEALQRFERAGFESFRSAFRKFDLLAGQGIEVEGPTGPLRGRACGLGENGALMVRVDEREEPVEIVCGEIRRVDDSAFGGCTRSGASASAGIRVRLASERDHA